MGSVKDIVVIERAPFPTGILVFSDRYSVFDWGEMPDHIPHRGLTRAMMAAYFFEQLIKRDLRTHYHGMKNEDGIFTRTDMLTEPSNEMMIYLLEVVKPVLRNGKYDYSAFHSMKDGFLLSAEVIYRNEAPAGSSIYRRLDEGSLSLQSMGLIERPSQGNLFPSTVLDASTKHEQFDRYPDERKGENRKTFLHEITGLSGVEIEEMDHMTLKANDVITEGIDRAGLRHGDGKLEFGLAHGRHLMYVDAAGTLDEIRATYPINGQRVDLSKQIPRDYYTIKQPEWVAEIAAAKKEYPTEWKSHVETQPNPMPHELVQMLSNIDRTVANAVLDRNLFPGTPPLSEVAREYRRFRELEMKV